ncbi:MAG TPA: universal stress protein, partial [Chitinophagaceae bacterium]|nr:universal stress protein [Chitinophagaceae bacterium]
IYSVIYPLMSKSRKIASIQMHPDMPGLQNLEVPSYKKIALALDFSENDYKLLASALGQAGSDSRFVLIHIVETATSILLGTETDDYETNKDQERLDFFVGQLRDKGYDAEGILGFRHRAKEIVRIVKDTQSDLLVVGAHGHTGLKDWLYGETIEHVRHELNIPVLVVHL